MIKLFLVMVIVRDGYFTSLIEDDPSSQHGHLVVSILFALPDAMVTVSGGWYDHSRIEYDPPASLAPLINQFFSSPPDITVMVSGGLCRHSVN